jgi:hypothetical protein
LFRLKKGFDFPVDGQGAIGGFLLELLFELFGFPPVFVSAEALNLAGALAHFPADPIAEFLDLGPLLFREMQLGLDAFGSQQAKSPHSSNSSHGFHRPGGARGLGFRSGLRGGWSRQRQKDGQCDTLPDRLRPDSHDATPGETDSGGESRVARTPSIIPVLPREKLGKQAGVARGCHARG